MCQNVAEHVAGEAQEEEKYDFSENRNTRLAFIAHRQFATSVRSVRIRIRN